MDARRSIGAGVAALIAAVSWGSFWLFEFNNWLEYRLFTDSPPAAGFAGYILITGLLVTALVSASLALVLAVRAYDRAGRRLTGWHESILLSAGVVAVWIGGAYLWRWAAVGGRIEDSWMPYALYQVAVPVLAVASIGFGLGTRRFGPRVGWWVAPVATGVLLLYLHGLGSLLFGERMWLNSASPLGWQLAVCVTWFGWLPLLWGRTSAGAPSGTNGQRATGAHPGNPPV